MNFKFKIDTTRNINQLFQDWRIKKNQVFVYLKDWINKLNSMNGSEEKMKNKILIIFIILSLLLTAEGVRKMWVIDSEGSLGRRKTGLVGDTFRVVTWVDPQTGVEYLIFEDFYINTQKAGLGISVVPRLNADGTMRIVK